MTGFNKYVSKFPLLTLGKHLGSVSKLRLSELEEASPVYKGTADPDRPMSPEMPVARGTNVMKHFLVKAETFASNVTKTYASIFKMGLNQDWTYDLRLKHLLEKSRTRMVSIWGMKPGLKRGKLFVAPRTAGVVRRDRLLEVGTEPKPWD